MRLRTAVVLSALVLAAGGGMILPAQAGTRHSHAVKMVYRSDSKSIAGDGVQFVLVFCPASTKVTGAGSSTPGISYVNEQSIDRGSNSITVFYINVSSSPSTIRAQAACVKKKTSRTRAKLGVSAALTQEREQAIQRAERKRSELQAQLPG
jgi:hypothetical protein